MKDAGLALVARVEQAVGDALREAWNPGWAEAVVVAVSGGADSLCLLHALHRLSADLHLSLHVAHLDHMLRGAESTGDAAFVSAQADALGLSCTIEARDVAAYRDERRCSLEEAAREVRYSFLRDVAWRTGACAVLTGHTRDDAVETVMLHILRGTGVHGLRGLEPASAYPRTSHDARAKDAPVLLRPLLKMSREDTRAYCGALSLQPREDSSNDSTAPLRNRIRLELLPSMRRLNARFDDALLRLARLAAEDDDLLMSITREQWKRLATPFHDSVGIELSGLLEASPAVQSRLILEAMTYLNGNARDVSAEHVSAVRSISRKPVGKQVDLPCGIVWRRDEARLTAFRRGKHAPDTRLKMPVSPVALPVPGEACIPGGRIVARVGAPGAESPGSPLVAFLDLAQTGRALFVRRREPGDRFRPLGMSDEKKLQDFMVDAHVAASARDSIPIVCSPGHIVWVVGWRIDDRVKMTAGTREVVRLEFVPRE